MVTMGTIMVYNRYMTGGVKRRLRCSFQQLSAVIIKPESPPPFKLTI